MIHRAVVGTFVMMIEQNSDPKAPSKAKIRSTNCIDRAYLTRSLVWGLIGVQVELLMLAYCVLFSPCSLRVIGLYIPSLDDG